MKRFLKLTVLAMILGGLGLASSATMAEDDCSIPTNWTHTNKGDFFCNEIKCSVWYKNKILKVNMLGENNHRIHYTLPADRLTPQLLEEEHLKKKICAKIFKDRA